MHLLRNDPLLGRRLDGYLDALARGEPHQVARNELGNISLIEQRMRDHAASAFVEHVSSRALPPPTAVKVETLDAAASRLVDLELAWKFGKDRPRALAGLGELGKHGSLITRDFGPSLRLGAVSTALPRKIVR